LLFASCATLLRSQRRAYSLVHCRRDPRVESVMVSWLSCKRNPLHDTVEMQLRTGLDSVNCRLLRRCGGGESEFDQSPM
jgi:hypothetical protein